MKRTGPNRLGRNSRPGRSTFVVRSPSAGTPQLRPPGGAQSARRGSYARQIAAVWVRQLTRDGEPADRSWIASFVEAYASWTAEANGAGLDRLAEIDGRSDAWNDAYFPLAAEVCASLPRDKAVTFIAAAIDVPDQSFFDVVEELVPALDQFVFNDRGLDLDAALALRAQVADRMLQTIGWQREEDRATMSVETRIGPAIAPLFFCRYNPFTETRCYLLPKGIDRIDPFLPLLARLIASGSVPFTALLSMSLLEVSPRGAHLPFLLDSATVWLRRQPTNTEFWIDHGFGARVTRWLAGVLQSDATLSMKSAPLGAQIDDVLARLVQVGRGGSTSTRRSDRGRTRRRWPPAECGFAGSPLIGPNRIEIALCFRSIRASFTDEGLAEPTS